MAYVPESHSRHHNAIERSYQDVSLSDSSRAHLGDVVNINNYSRPVEQSDEDKRWKGVQQALSFDRMEVRRRNIDPAYGDTCRWVLETKEYCRWRDEALWDEHHGFLWIKGNPGVGKSTIMKFLLEHAQANLLGHVILSFFFNARGGSLETSTEGLYRSLLLQLLRNVPTLRPNFSTPDLDVQGTQWPMGVTQDLFREALLLLGKTPITIFIDALDEGEQKEVRDMVGYLGRLVTHTKIASTSLDICFASRHYPRITMPFCEELNIDRQPSHNEDIRKYVAENLVFDSTIRRLSLRHHVVSKAQGVFLWVVLVVSILNENFDRGLTANQLENTLNTIPGDLDGLLSEILRKGASDSYLLPALQSIIASEDSIGVGAPQLFFMILIGAGKLTSPVWDHEQANLATMKRFILQSTKGLVEIINTGGLLTFQFVHESVRQHLLRGGLTRLFASLKDNVKAHCHAKLADSCQTYIKLIGHEQLYDKHLAQSRPSDKELPLLWYVHQYAMWHIKHAHAGGFYGLETLLTFPMTIWIRIERCFPGTTGSLEPSPSLLYVFVDRGCSSLATETLEHYKTWLESGPTGVVGVPKKRNHLIDTLVGLDPIASQRRHMGRTMLMEAAEMGYYETVQLLLECGADVKSVTEDGASALSLAVRSAHVDVVQLLLECGAEIEHEYGYFGYPLVLAALDSTDHVDVVKLLLEHGADANVMGRSYGTALMAATSNGSLAAMNLLLQHGADPNIVNSTIGWDGTALEAAARKGNVEKTKLLLLHGADVELMSRAENVRPRSSSMRRFVLSCRETEGSNEADQLHEG